MSVTLYHNPRCSKSRQTLALLEEKGITPDIVLYLETPPDTKTLTNLVKQLGIAPRELLRKGETDYKENNLKDSGLSDQQIIKLMTQFPKLIERPIVVCNGKARIGRPPESVLEII